MLPRLNPVFLGGIFPDRDDQLGHAVLTLGRAVVQVVGKDPHAVADDDLIAQDDGMKRQQALRRDVDLSASHAAPAGLNVGT